MDPWLLQALADMTPEEYAEALRTGQFTPQKRLPRPPLEGEVMPRAPKPVRPGLPAGAPGLPSGAPQLGPGLPGLPAGGAQAALPRGAIPQPPGAFAGAPPAAPQYPPISLSSIREGASAGAEQFGNMQTAVRQAPVPGSPQFAAASTQVQPQAPNPLRVPIPRAGAQPIPFTPSPSMTDPGLSAVRPKPFGLEDLLQADRPPPPLKSPPIPELPGEPLPAPRGAGAPAPIAAAGAPVRPAVPAPAAPATPSSMPRLPGMEGISQVDGAFGAGASGEQAAWKQYLAGRGGQPGLAGAASGGGIGSPVPPLSSPGMPPPPPPAAGPALGVGASPGASAASGRAFSQADEAMLRVRAALEEARQFAPKPSNPLMRGASAIGRGISKAALPLTAAYVGGSAVKGGMDAYDPNASPLSNVGNVAGGVASEGGSAAYSMRPTPMNIMFGGGLADMADPNFKLGGIAGAAKGLYDWATSEPGVERFTEAQPGTAAAIRAAMDSGQPGQSRAPAFDMSNPQPADPGATPPAAPPVRPRTAGSGSKRPQAPAIPPPSGETGVSDGSPAAGTSPYKLLGEKLSVPMVENMGDTRAPSAPTAVRPGGPAWSSTAPTGAWAGRGMASALNDPKGVMGEGRRMPLGAGPGQGARYGLDTEMKGVLAGAGQSPGMNFGKPDLKDPALLAVRPELKFSTADEKGIGEPIGGMDEELEEDPEEKRARLARMGSRQSSPRFLSPQ